MKKKLYEQISKINVNSIDITGTQFMMNVDSSYKNIVNKFGPPMVGCGYKTDAEWHILFNNGVVATIYNWKNGRNYNGPRGTPTEDIKTWNIGSSKKNTANIIRDLILN